MLPVDDLPFTLIGRMVMKWNEAEQVWFLIYTCIAHDRTRTDQETAFRQFPISLQQREFTLRAATERLASPQHAAILTALRLAKEDSDRLAEARNAIVHASYSYTLDTDNPFLAMADPTMKLSVGISGSNWRKKANQFQGMNLTSELERLLRDIQQLVTQLDQIRQHLIWRYLPEKPMELSENLPQELRAAMLRADPAFSPPSQPLVWNIIRT
jgi:hypothetical protein